MNSGYCMKHEESINGYTTHVQVYTDTHCSICIFLCPFHANNYVASDPEFASLIHTRANILILSRLNTMSDAMKREAAEWKEDKKGKIFISGRKLILGVVKRNPLFFRSISCKNNGFLFTTPNIYLTEV